MSTLSDRRRQVFHKQANPTPVSRCFSKNNRGCYRILRCCCNLLLLSFSISTCLAAQSVTVSPTSLGFGSQAKGTPSVSKNVVLKNGQTSAITISSITTNLADYTQTNNCPMSPATLHAGKSCTIAVTFTPAALGSRTATLTFNDSGRDNPQLVKLNGTGIADLTVAPTSLSFGNWALGEKSTALSVTVKNNERQGIVLYSVDTSLADYSTLNGCPMSPNVLAAGATCAISVYFTPSALGSRPAKLSVTDNANNNLTVKLNGTGVLAATVRPTSLTFGSLPLGTTSTPQSVVLKNNQSSALTITGIATTLADFSFTSTCPLAPETLGGGKTCTTSVVFSPQAVGSRVGSLNFTDDANNSPQTVSLKGTGLPAALVSIAITPANPSLAVGTTLQLKATGKYTDGSTQDLTKISEWTSSNNGVVTVNASGLATAVSVGVATVQASVGAIVGSTTVTVTAAQPILSRIPENVCVSEAETSISASCVLPAGIPVGDGLVVFITSTTGAPLSSNALQDSADNTYTLLAGPVSGGYGSVYMAYSQLSSALVAGNALTLSVPSSDSWGLSLYNIGPVLNNSVDTGVTVQNPEAGLPGYNNPLTGVPGWWTGQTSPTTGTQDLCMATLGVGPGSSGNGAPEPVTTFTADNNFTGSAMTQYYAQSDPNYVSGGSVLPMYVEVAAGTAVQSHVVTNDSIPNNAPAALYCFKEGSGTVQQIPWFTGNFCTAHASCTIDNVTAGNMLVINSHTFNLLPDNPITVTDSLDESVMFDEISESTGLGTWHISPVLNSGNHTITVNDPMDSTLLIDVAEISGQGSGNPVEAIGQNSFNSSSLAFADLTTITANDLLLGWGRSYFGSDEGEGFTGIRVAPTTEYAVAPSAGPQTVLLRPRGTPPWTITGVQAIAIRPAGSAQPAQSIPYFTGNYCMAQANSCTIDNVTHGDILVISSWWGGTLTNLPQVTDSLGETIIVDRGNDSDGTITLSTWHIPSIVTAGAHTISINFASLIVVTEYAAQSQTKPIDAVTGVIATSGQLPTASVQTSEGNDLIYAWCGADSNTGFGDGFAAIRLSPTAELRAAASTPGLETADCPAPDNTGGWVIQELAIKH